MTSKAKARIKIPRKTEAELMYMSNLQCCICGERGDHIHHLLSPKENSIENLALLCFKHHDEATVTQSLRKKLSLETIKRFRKEHYSRIENIRKKRLASVNR